MVIILGLFRKSDWDFLKKPSTIQCNVGCLLEIENLVMLLIVCLSETEKLLMLLAVSLSL